MITVKEIREAVRALSAAPQKQYITLTPQQWEELNRFADEIYAPVAKFYETGESNGHKEQA